MSHDKISKVVHDSELSERALAMSNAATNIAKQVCPQIWNLSVMEMKQFSPFTGDEALSHYSTMLSFLNGWYIANMKKNIVDEDETGYTIDQLLVMVFDGTAKLLKSDKEFKPYKTENALEEIKRL